MFKNKFNAQQIVDVLSVLFLFTLERKKKRAVKMMVTIVVLFTICWAPFHTVHMLFDYCKYGRSGWAERRAAGK